MMVFGCPRDYALAVLLISAPVPLVSMLFVKMPWNLVLAGVVFGFLWGLGVLLAKIDPEFFTIFVVKTFRIGKTASEYDGNEYLP